MTSLRCVSTPCGSTTEGMCLCILIAVNLGKGGYAPFRSVPEQSSMQDRFVYDIK